MPDDAPSSTRPAVALVPFVCAGTWIVMPLVPVTVVAVLSVTFAGRSMGNVSGAPPVNGTVSTPPPVLELTRLIVVFAAGEGPMTSSARVIDWKAQASPPLLVVLPVPLPSLPRTGSTTYVGDDPLTAGQV